ncbi:tetraacyldisaccharide 4'-kinase [Lichenicola sp.]|uniref:tetraacyldisaccharide 4'-kinase n=1 Tax=Lichenicola sp. TaxID=2804529 RepID=UPI003B0052B5
MFPPAFWSIRPPTALARLLGPVGGVTAWATARRLRRPGWRAPVPVICCGNVGVGGAGKTTVALDLARRLQARGIAVHCLTRGYGGRVRGVLRVDPDRHDAVLTGDEALLLAGVAPTWVSADRAASARAAIGAGAQILLMDDGLQNPGLVQDWPLLVIDGASGFGNGRLLPAGPLREPVATAMARARAVILIGADAAGVTAQLPSSLPLLRADLVMEPGLLGLRGEKLLAFAGIARPEKFFAALRGIDLELAATRGFPDHHRFSAADIEALRRDALRLQAILVTTPKDAVRLPPDMRAEVVVADVSLRWDAPGALQEMLDRMTGTSPSAGR